MGVFTAQLDAFAAKAKGNIDLVVRKVSFEMFRRVIVKSPVDTGRFKGNWQPAIGSIPGGVLATLDKSGSASIAKVTAETRAAKAGDIIYLINNLPYANRLEFGWSKQAPAGMVRLTVGEFQGVVTQAANEVPK